MSPPNLTAPPATGPSPSDIPAFADLAVDPEIAPLLDFLPVVRKIRRPDGWTPELQCELIARLAATGTIQSAVWQMGKHATGAEALYKVPSADSFRASWDAAVAIGRRRNGLDSQPPYAGPIPGISRRGQTPLPSGRGRLEGEGGRSRLQGSIDAERGWNVGGGEGALPEADHEALAQSLFRKYLLKVQAERKARLAGKVVEADFYLRQLTFFEVTIDLAQEHQGVDTWTWLAGLRRDGHNLFDIARTPFSRFLDEARRLVWAGGSGEPERPETTAEEYLLDRDGYSLEPPEAIRGGPDVNIQAQWAKLEKRHRAAAAEQIAWERHAQSAWGADEHDAGAAEHKSQSHKAVAADHPPDDLTDRS